MSFTPNHPKTPRNGALGSPTANDGIARAINRERRRLQIISLAAALLISLLLLALMAMVQSTTSPAPSKLIARSGDQKENTRDENPHQHTRISPPPPAKLPAVHAPDSFTELALPISLVLRETPRRYEVIFRRTPIDFSHKLHRNSQLSLFGHGKERSGKSIGIIRDVSVSMDRHAKSIDRFLSLHFPESPILLSDDGSVKNANGAVEAIERMARRPEIRSILFISDLKNDHNYKGIKRVERSLFSAGATIRLYIITMHELPPELLQKLVMKTGGEVYDYSNDYDLSWREVSGESSQVWQRHTIKPARVDERNGNRDAHSYHETRIPITSSE